MRNGHKSVFFLFLVVFVTAFSAVGRAEEDNESNQAEPQVEYAESTSITPKAEKAQLEATKLPEALDVQPVTASTQAVSPAVAPAVSAPVPVPEAIPAGEIIPGEATTSSPVVPSGLLEVDGYKYPVYLFVPKDYKTDRTYAMIMIAPAEFAKAEKQIEYLTGLAQRKSLFILAPYVLWPKSGTTPYTLDEWLLYVKNDIMGRFPIDKKRVFLVGRGSGAQYAGYLAVKYPHEFSAAALLSEAWDGPFSKLVDPQSSAADQMPFYIALKAGGDAKARNQAWFDKFQQKGYPIHLVDYKMDEELDQLEFKKSVFDWLEANSQNWAVSVASSRKTWKGKFKKGVKDFFAV